MNMHNTDFPTSVLPTSVPRNAALAFAPSPVARLERTLITIRIHYDQAYRATSHPGHAAVWTVRHRDLGTVLYRLRALAHDHIDIWASSGTTVSAPFDLTDTALCRMDNEADAIAFTRQHEARLQAALESVMALTGRTHPVHLLCAETMERSRNFAARLAGDKNWEGETSNHHANEQVRPVASDKPGSVTTKRGDVAHTNTTPIMSELDKETREDA